jgi:hypothetical protein
VDAAATMTEPAPAPRREPIRKPGPFPVIAASLGLFLAITALLAFQMRAGADPALGEGEPQLVAAAPPAPRKVLIRRVIVTRIVEHRADRVTARSGGASGSAGGAAPSASAPAASGSGAPSGPAASAPAAGSSAPPAPAAPLTTRSS